jgi:REP element-mobilizing transposase RayT
MHFEQGKYYHLYNCSNNNELVFKSDENYSYFLSKFYSYLSPHVISIAYCLMPTHFHFIVKIQDENEVSIQKAIGLLLSSYTKAI